ncbi:hypothetical protein [Salisaeta longa]|uniref:hypothetical protein n=1 Tax=Salisaeta longa TaxID=503170 RepID=UPI0012F8B84B|nr:hypothetical protein [Salisaeta longa]
MQHSAIRSARHTFFLMLIAAIGLVGCDSAQDEATDRIGPGGDGSVSVSGNASNVVGFDGRAFFATEADLNAIDESSGFSLVVFDVSAEDTLLVAFGRDAAGLPSEGDHTISSDPTDQQFIGLYYHGTAATSTLAGSQSGTMSFTRIGSDEVEGSFSFDGQAFDLRNFSGQPEAMSAEGTFTAERVTEEDVRELQDLFGDIGS